MNEELDQLDEIAFEVCGGYQAAGMASFLIRTMSDGNVRVIGPQIARELVVRMLRSAADAFESGSELVQVKH